MVVLKSIIQYVILFQNPTNINEINLNFHLNDNIHICRIMIKMHVHV